MFVDVSRDGDIFSVTINRPEALNSLNTAVLSELEEALDALAADDTPSVVIVTGAGDKAFVAGADLAEMRDMSPLEAYAFAERGHAVFKKVADLPQPTIAAVNGFALGGGCELAMACDMRVASSTARFSAPEVAFGIIPGFGATQRLPRLVGVAKALEMILSAQPIDAQEAAAVGLVNRVVAPDQLWDEVLGLARAISANGRHAVRQAKRAVWASQDCGVEQGCEIEASLFESCFGDEQRERMTAFLEKRGKK